MRIPNGSLASCFITVKILSEFHKDAQKQALQLSTSDRWQLIQALLESLKDEANPKPKQGNL
ncbi:MAG: hypothetical protein V7L27_17055 [Nostoc sp.]|uniref:hypothetical protein n=1 Tax=Nostoc sp. TaxID=1180 RepID=UPI002FF6295C